MFPTWIVGLVLSTLASFLGCLGMALQKMAHRDILEERTKTMHSMNRSRPTSPAVDGSGSPPTAGGEGAATADQPLASAHSRIRNKKRPPKYGSTCTISEGDEVPTAVLPVCLCAWCAVSVFCQSYV